MAEIYQLPENGGNNGNFGGLPFSIPIGGNNGGLFGNGNNSLADLFCFAIIASMFGWNNGGWGNGGWGGGLNGQGAFLANQLNNDSGRELIMNAVTSQGEASRTAIQSLATALGQDFNLVNSGVQNVQNAIAQLANAQGTSALQILPKWMLLRMQGKTVKLWQKMPKLQLSNHKTLSQQQSDKQQHR